MYEASDVLCDVTLITTSSVDILMIIAIVEMIIINETLLFLIVWHGWKGKDLDRL